MASLAMVHGVLGQAIYPVTSELSDTSRPARPPEKGNGFKAGISDGLLHIDPAFDGDQVISILKENKVRRAVIMPVPNEALIARGVDGSAQKLRMAQANTKTIRAMCGGDYLSNWLADARGVSVDDSTAKEKFSRLAADLDSGYCIGVGEFGLLHFNKLGNQNVIQNQHDAPLVLKMVDVVGTRGAWIQLHAEPREPNGRSHEKVLWDTLQMWTQRQPRLKIVLSHTGMTSAPNARLLLATFPNLYLSIKHMSSDMVPWRHLEPILNSDGHLYEDWATLMEDMPTRFIIGTDAKFGQSGHEHEGVNAYEKMIAKYRRTLGVLKPDVAKRIASENVKSLFGFKNSAGAEKDESD